jgi:hypothetical protein
VSSVDFSEVAGPVRAAAKQLRRDGAGVAVVDRLTASLVSDLANEKLCAIHVRGFFPKAVARRAARTLSALGRHQVWVVAGRKTDTTFNIGLPRQYADASKAAAARYRREAKRANAAIRAAFAPSASPLDLLRVQLDELWAKGARLGRFEGDAALAGLVRTVAPSTLLPGMAGERGVIHMDDLHRKRGDEHRLSSNLYLQMPSMGGSLSIWDVAVSEANQRNLVHRLCSGLGFEVGSQEILHVALTRPHVIDAQPGDLVLLDTARPHAVGGFTRGTRMSLQSWVMTPPGGDGPLTVFA